MTDFRALCAELFENLERYQCWYIEDNGYGIDELEALLDRADAALSQPEPQEPSDEEIRDLWSWAAGQDQGPWPTQQHCFARAVLARWGRPAIKPVPVGERLPKPDDLDDDGRCWLLTVEDDYPQWRLHSIQGAQPGGYMIWVPVDSDGAMVDCFYTSHWLPAHALPVPQQEADHD